MSAIRITNTEESNTIEGGDCHTKAGDQPVLRRTRRSSSNNFRPSSDRDETMTGDKRKTMDCDTPIKAEIDDLNPISFEELTKIYEKNQASRTADEVRLLDQYACLLPEVKARIKARQDKETLRQRCLEFEEPIDVIRAKADELADLIKRSKHVVIYTGAGISTSASIPDYRGPNGLWTQIRQTGSFSITKVFDLSKSEPTYTHMAIKELARKRIVKHVVSQNCDGLHLRSGIPQSQLSEIHGNMYIEVCPTCNEKQYFRQADVTERTSRFRHKTGRKCHSCQNNLIDTIVLYGEKSRTKWPMNWERASKMAKRADLIICMGSSLKTLRRYGCLWPKSIGSSSSKRESETKLVIINLQYTSKDKNAVLKINGKCDLVMQLVMQRLNIDVPAYDWSVDPLSNLSTPFTQEERTNLKRNLIFEPPGSAPESPSLMSTASSSSTSQLRNNKPKSEARSSPSLFVSELTDDPDKKRLKMRIRAVNIETDSNLGDADEFDESSAASIDDDDDDDNDNPLRSSTLNVGGRSEIEDHENKNRAGGEIKIESLAMTKIKQKQHNSHLLPGWLGKSLGSGKTSSYRRKRHGNKGRKHALRHQQPISEPADIQAAAAAAATAKSPQLDQSSTSCIANIKSEDV